VTNGNPTTGRPRVDLSGGEPNFDTPAATRIAGMRAIQDGETRYTDIEGTKDRRDAIRQYFDRHDGLAYGDDAVVASVGANPAILNALLAQGDRVVSMAVVVFTGVRADGDREVLGLDVGLSEDVAFWTTFLRSLVARGLHWGRLVISDAHEGLRQAIQPVMQGASWQRCRVHFLRNVRSQVPKASPAMVAALVRTIFVQPDREAARAHLTQVAAMLRDRYPKAAELLETAAEDSLAFMRAPAEHWRQIYSTNPLERLNKEMGRRTDVVGICPNRAAVLRLVGAVLLAQNDAGIAAPRRYFRLESMAKLKAASETALELPTAL